MTIPLSTLADVSCIARALRARSVYGFSIVDSEALRIGEIVNALDVPTRMHGTFEHLMKLDPREWSISPDNNPTSRLGSGFDMIVGHVGGDWQSAYRAIDAAASRLTSKGCLLLAGLYPLTPENTSWRAFVHAARRPTSLDAYSVPLGDEGEVFGLVLRTWNTAPSLVLPLIERMSEKSVNPQWLRRTNLDDVPLVAREDA
jgi:hypothetical protein